MERDVLFLGIDPNHSALIESSQTAASRKGGLENVRYVLGSAEALPGPFGGRVTSATILFPWGSLLRAALSGEGLDGLRDACRPGALIELVTAIEAEADAGELERLGVEALSPAVVARNWQRAGFQEIAVEQLPPDHAYQTTWWRRIRHREGRQAWRLSARA